METPPTYKMTCKKDRGMGWEIKEQMLAQALLYATERKQTLSAICYLLFYGVQSHYKKQR